MIENLLDWINRYVLSTFTIRRRSVQIDCQCGSSFDVPVKQSKHAICPQCKSPVTESGTQSHQWRDHSRSTKHFLFGFVQLFFACLLWLFFGMELYHGSIPEPQHTKSLLMYFFLATGLTALAVTSFRSAIYGVPLKETDDASSIET